MKLIVGCLVVVLSVYLEAALLDVNKDGVYDRNEFHWAFPNADLYQEFDRLDANKDGLITSEEVELGRTATGEAVESRIRGNIGKIFTSLPRCQRSCRGHSGWRCPLIQQHPRLWICR